VYYPRQPNDRVFDPTVALAGGPEAEGAHRLLDFTELGELTAPAVR
jgi:hypothetical protein